MTAAVVLTPAATKLARKGHPWYYADDLARSPGHAALVRIASSDDHDLGVGLYSPASRLVLRLAGSWPGDGAPEAAPFFARRVAAAVARRREFLGPRAGVRLVHGEADGLPGLVVDQYDDCVVLQITAAVLEQELDVLVPALVAATGATSVVARNDVRTRRFEGLPEEVRLLHGRRRTEVTIEEGGVAHVARPFDGHKTGFYLDQRPARARVQELGAGRDVLDLFCYQGGFSLAALRGGGRSALAIDQSREALHRAERAAGDNGLSGLETLPANAFEALRDLRRNGRQFGLVIVDPPAFAKSRRERRGAERGYRDLNRLALRVLQPGGFLLTCSCSHHVSRPMFEDVLRQAAAQLPFRVVLRERLMAGADHPTWVSLPESEYLKVCLLQRVDDDVEDSPP